MEFTGERTIAADRAAVFAALNDPDILRQSIPGCESLEKTSDSAFDANVALKVGPVKAKYTCAVTLENVKPRESYTLVGEGKGGTAGFAKGKADVSLTENGEGTLLSYSVHADISGKIAQLGSRLIQGTANRLSAEFFDTFAALIEQRTAEADGDAVDISTEAAPDESTPMISETPTQRDASRWVWWVVGAIVLIVAAVFLWS